MGRPKALTLIQGAPAVARIAGELRAAGVDDITIVAPVGVELPELGVRVVRNPDPDAGRTGSLQMGLLVRRDEGEDEDEGPVAAKRRGLSSSRLAFASSPSSPASS